MTYIEIFFYLQALDFMTTIAGIRLGGSELSPFVRWMLQFDTVAGLAAVKLLGFVLGGLCIWMRRTRVIVWVNYVFAAIVIWNLCNILKAVSPVN